MKNNKNNKEVFRTKKHLSNEFIEKVNQYLNMSFKELQENKVPVDTTLLTVSHTFEDGTTFNIEVYTTGLNLDEEYEIKKALYVYNLDDLFMDDIYHVYDEPQGLLGNYRFMDNDSKNQYILSLETN